MGESLGTGKGGGVRKRVQWGVEPILPNAQQIKNTTSQLHAKRQCEARHDVFYVVEKWKIEMDIG